MNIQSDRALLPAGRPARRHLVFRVTAPGKAQPSERPAVSVAVVLDRSGSMAGRKFALAQQAVVHAAQLLSERDRLSVVCFDDQVETILESAPVTAGVRAQLAERLRAIEPRANTDLHRGWMTGAAQVRPSAAPPDIERDDVVRRVLLLTDGQANRGETSPDLLATVAAELAQAGVATTCFGLGADFDEQLLARISREGAGRFYYIEAPQQIADYFTSELGEALEVVARDAVLEVAGAPGVVFTCLNDFRVDVAHKGAFVRVHLGDLVAEQQVTVVVSVDFDPAPAGSVRPIAARLGDRDGVLYPKPMDIDWRVVSVDEDAAQAVSAEVVTEVALLHAASARAAAVAANRAGDFAMARRCIREGVEAIRVLAPQVPAVQRIADELARQVEVFEERLSVQRIKDEHFDTTSMLRSRGPRGRARQRDRAS